MKSEDHKKGGGPLRMILPLTKALVHDVHARRQVMFYTIIAAAAMVVVGGTLLFDWLRSTPLLFIGFWLACAWLTGLAVLLAIFDILLLRLHARQLERELREKLKNEAQFPND